MISPKVFYFIINILNFYQKKNQVTCAIEPATSEFGGEAICVHTTRHMIRDKTLIEKYMCNISSNLKFCKQSKIPT